jgi:hypothetical protein
MGMSLVPAIARPCPRFLQLLGPTVLLAACGSEEEARGTDTTLDTMSASDSMTMPISTDGDDDGITSEGDDAPTTLTASDDDAPATTDDGAVDSGDDTTTTGDPETFMMSDPLVGATMGTALGGSFGADGWTVTGNADRIYWALPRLVEGSVEFTMSNVTLANLPLPDHEVFGLYEGGHDIEHPINYNPEYRVNAYKSMIRIYGTAEPKRAGQQKIMWGMCPGGAPGYFDACPCTSFFEEPFGGDGNWDGSPQRLRVEWGGGHTRYLRNGAVVLDIDWSGSGMAFGPNELYVSIGTPRPEDVAEASMPIGAVFSDVVIEGVLGPEATCG